MLIIMNFNHTFQKSILCSKTKRNICFMFHKILLTNHLKSWSFQYQIVKWFNIIYYIYILQLLFRCRKGSCCQHFLYNCSNDNGSSRKRGSLCTYLVENPHGIEANQNHARKRGSDSSRVSQGGKTDESVCGRFFRTVVGPWCCYRLV